MPGTYSAEDKIFLEALGAAVKSSRTRLGLSQEKLAEMTDLHRTYISSLERGERNVSALNIRKIATSLNIRPSRLLEEVESRLA